jgi:hypothetical protein
LSEAVGSSFGYLTPVEKFRNYIDINFPHVFPKTIALDWSHYQPTFRGSGMTPMLTLNPEGCEDYIGGLETELLAVITYRMKEHITAAAMINQSSRPYFWCRQWRVRSLTITAV